MLCRGKIPQYASTATHGRGVRKASAWRHLTLSGRVYYVKVFFTVNPNASYGKLLQLYKESEKSLVT